MNGVVAVPEIMWDSLVMTVRRIDIARHNPTRSDLTNLVDELVSVVQHIEAPRQVADVAAVNADAKRRLSDHSLRWPGNPPGGEH